MGHQDTVSTPASHRRFLIRFFDNRARLDYLWAFLLAAWPLLFACLLRVHETRGEFVGYWERPNWTAFALNIAADVVSGEVGAKKRHFAGE